MKFYLNIKVPWQCIGNLDEKPRSWFAAGFLIQRSCMIRLCLRVPSRKAIDEAVFLDWVNDGNSSSHIKLLDAELKGVEVCCRPVTRTQQPGGAMIFLGGAITYNKFNYGQLKYKL